MTIASIIQYVNAELKRTGQPTVNQAMIIQHLQNILNAEVRNLIKAYARDYLRKETQIKWGNGVNEISLFDAAGKTYWIGDIIRIDFQDEAGNWSKNLLKVSEIGANYNWPNVSGMPTIYAVYNNEILRLHPIPPDGTLQKGIIYITHYTRFLPIVEEDLNTGLTLEKVMFGDAATSTVAATLVGEIAPYIQNLILYQLTGNAHYYNLAQQTYVALVQARGYRIVDKTGNLQT